MQHFFKKCANIDKKVHVAVLLRSSCSAELNVARLHRSYVVLLAPLELAVVLVNMVDQTSRVGATCRFDKTFASLYQD